MNSRRAFRFTNSEQFLSQAPRVRTGVLLLAAVANLATSTAAWAQAPGFANPATGSQATQVTTSDTGASVGLPALTLGATGSQRPNLSTAQDYGQSDLRMNEGRGLRAADDTGNNAAQRRQRKPAVPSQFQRFVLESTGQRLDHFGSELFDNPQAYAVDSAAPAPADYVLGPGDEVRIQIWGAVDFAANLTLDRNGQVTLPKVGTLNLAGTQVKDLEAAVRKQVAGVFTNVSLNASLGRLRGITVYVVGQARQPGTYNLNSLSTLVNAVFASGGPGVNGSMRNIRLQRGGQTVTTLDLYDFIAKGDKGKDVRLQPGDVITIPPAGPRIALTGATDHSAIYEVKPGSTLQDVLALGGGVPTLASPQKALVESVRPDITNGPREVTEITLSGAGLSQALRDGDIVTLLPISPAFSNAVTLAGNVAQPLRHRWFPGMRVQDLIPDRDALISPDYYRRKTQAVRSNSTKAPRTLHGVDKSEAGLELTGFYAGRDSTASASEVITESIRGLTEQINWDYAVIERLNRNDLRTELIPFNLAKAVVDKDPAHNLPLQSGDVVTILSSKDMRLPVARQVRLVRVEGEVAAPGIYQAMAGETLPQLIQRIGGLTPQAYLYGTEFTRESVRKQQQQNLDQLVRRLESQTQSAGATLASNLTGERAAQAASIQQAQQAQMQAQINRLKTMKSQGRVSLELDPEQAAGMPTAKGGAHIANLLPNIPLEDGDSIVIPPAPAFVAAMGSVNNENVFIHKSGKTVGDILRSAGLTEDAEPSEAFLLRADGSIVSRKSAGFFSAFESIKVMPGDILVVPAMMDRESRYNFIVRSMKDWTQIFSNLGIGAAAIKTLRN